MVRGGWLHAGLVWWGLVAVGGIIEIVEEQQCSDFRFRLTCRDLQAHIAVLQAWWTSAEDLTLNRTSEQTNETNTFQIQTELEAELNRVYVYSSPNNNGFYEPMNHSIFENNTHWPLTTNLTSAVNGSFYGNVNETVEVPVEVTVDSESDNATAGCGVRGFARSYASWREGDKGKRKEIRDTSVNLRAPLSYRCTGVNHCSFILPADHAAAAAWPPGAVYIKYACFDDTLSIHYCNREVSIAASGPDSEGYIRSPGYPHFYIGEDECGWRLTVSPEQRIRVTLLDVSLRSIGPFEEECTDYVTVRESNGEPLLSSCDQVDLPLQLVSKTNAVDITVQARSQGAYPKRGVLIYYKSIDCVTLPAPSDGYLVYRNAHVAHYMCNVNHVFEDTHERARLLWCYDDNRWNDTVPSCVETALKGVENVLGASETEDSKLPHTEANMLVDIVIPSLLIAALFIGNAFIVLIIYKYRKRKTDDIEDEFNTIPLSVNGNVHTAGNAV
ncbi:uncharacterized protein LOC105389730 isoform X2 [Plutella xylostella]|uniref:uncharacterized protein LOC105389730 isoform X2 n=1 Tax=Plutella xylostella TaxID=51655 RepID=UPI002032F73E|nr:uncharacterized protein LOC105389730 isoform X2 [Plutella xylostella]